MNWRIVILAAALTAFAAPVFPAPPQTREEALQGLRSADAATRAEAIAWLAHRGAMADAPLLEARLRDESPFVRGFAEQGLWLLWGRSGDAKIDRLMARGIAALQAERHREAIETFTQVIREKPGFAEGWNKRATALFLAGEYQRAIADCREVLKRNPHHFGALSGLGQIYERLARPEEALGWFRKALEANPNLVGVEMEIGRLEAALRARRDNEI